MFYGKWPEGRRTIKIEAQAPVSAVTGRPLAKRRTKALVRALPDVEIEPESNSKEVEAR